VTINPGYYFAVIAVGNLLGPLVLSRPLDTAGRKPMSAGACLLSAPLPPGTALVESALASSRTGAGPGTSPSRSAPRTPPRHMPLTGR
jgi:hypothetical protein